MRHLEKIARAEGVQIEEAALYAIARGADGGMRDAESTLDQLISFCGEVIAEPDVLSMFGLTARAQLLALASAMLGGKAEAVLRELDGLARAGKDLGRLLTDLLGHFRNLLVYQVSRGDMDLIEVSEAEAAALKEQSPLVDTEPLTRMLEVLTDTEARLGDAVSKKITLEVALLKAVQARSALSVDAVLERLHQLRQENTTAPNPVLDPKAEESPAPSSVVRTRVSPPVAPGAAAARPAGGSDDGAASTAEPPAGGAVEAAPALEGLESLWSRLLDAVGRVSPFARSYLLKAFPASLDRGLLVVGFDPEFADYLPLVDNAKNQALLQNKLRELGVENPQVRFAKVKAAVAPPVAPSPASPAADAATASVPPAAPDAPASAKASAKTKPAKAAITRLDPTDFKDDPLIKQALEIFKAQIVEVRA